MSAALELLKEAALKLEEARKSGDQKRISEGNYPLTTSKRSCQHKPRLRSSKYNKPRTVRYA